MLRNKTGYFLTYNMTSTASFQRELHSLLHTMDSWQFACLKIDSFEINIQQYLMLDCDFISHQWHGNDTKAILVRGCMCACEGEGRGMAFTLPFFPIN